MNVKYLGMGGYISKVFDDETTRNNNIQSTGNSENIFLKKGSKTDVSKEGAIVIGSQSFPIIKFFSEQHGVNAPGMLT